MGLEFETAARQATEVDEGEILTLDGVELRYYRPSGGAVAMAMAMTEARKSDQSKVAGMIDFFFSVFDTDSQKILQARLWDPKDPFDIDTEGGIQDILDSLYEEWSARPTKRSSGSIESPATTGPSSAPAIPESDFSSSPATSS